MRCLFTEKERYVPLWGPYNEAGEIHIQITLFIISEHKISNQVNSHSVMIIIHYVDTQEHIAQLLSTNNESWWLINYSWQEN